MLCGKFHHPKVLNQNRFDMKSPWQAIPDKTTKTIKPRFPGAF